MATQKKISELDPATTLSETDVVPGNQGASTKKISITVLRTVLNAISQTFTGVLTATGFVGDGNGITGVVKTTGDQTITGKLSASQLEGDGSLITGVIAAGTGGTSSTSSLSLVSNSDGSTPAAKIVGSKDGVTVFESDENGFNIPTGSYKVNDEEILPTGIYWNLSTPLVYYDLSHDTRKIVRGEGSDTFTRSTVQNIVDPYGVVKEIAIDNSGAEKNGTKYEGPSTNLMTYSEQFDNAAWVKSGGSSVVANSITAPDGNTTADSLVYAADAEEIYNSVTITAATDYTFSVWLKTASGTANMLLGVSSGETTPIIVTSTWQRFSYTGQRAATTAFCVVKNNTGGAITIYGWGAQIEQLTFASSYIKTVASPVTRTTNISTLPYAGNFPDPENDMTIIIEFSIDGTFPASGWLLRIQAESTRDIFINTSRIISMRHGPSVLESTTALVPNQLYRLAYVNDGTNFLLYLNGVLEASIAQQTVTATASGLVTLGSSAVSGIEAMYGNIKTVNVYDRALTASEVRVA